MRPGATGALGERVQSLRRLLATDETFLAVDRQLTAERSTDFYALYLKGLHYWNSLTPEGLAKSRECYEGAVEIDPDYALAHAALSMWHQSLAFWADADPTGGRARGRLCELCRASGLAARRLRGAGPARERSGHGHVPAR